MSLGKQRLSQTLWVAAQGLEHISSLTNQTFGFLEHVEEVAQLAQQTCIADTCCSSVL